MKTLLLVLSVAMSDPSPEPWTPQGTWQVEFAHRANIYDMEFLPRGQFRAKNITVQYRGTWTYKNRILTVCEYKVGKEHHGVSTWSIKIGPITSSGRILPGGTYRSNPVVRFIKRLK